MTEPAAPGMPAPEVPGPEMQVQDGAGVPDGFARLWMPHRMAYIKGENKPAGPGG